MSWKVKISVGVHKHSVQITKQDIETILAQPAGIKKIAYQTRFIVGGTEPGHVFQLVVQQARA